MFTKNTQNLRIHLNLKQKKQTDVWTQIYITMTVNGKRIRVYSGLKVPPEYWHDYSSSCITRGMTNVRLLRELRDINKKIQMILYGIRILDAELAVKGCYLNHDRVRSVIKQYSDTKLPTNNPIQYMKKLIDSYDAGVNRRGARGVESSKVTYRTSLERLEKFKKASGRPLESFEEFDRQFFKEFTDYLYNFSYLRGGKMLHYTTNTVVNTLKVLKNFLHKAYDDEISDNDYFMRVQTVLPAKAADKIYLSEIEVAKFAHAEVKNMKEKELRDMFVLSCYTGLRISDIQNLNNALFDDGKIRLVQKKTNGEVVIPILREVKGLVTRYRSRGFPTFNYSWANRTLKVLADRAGINREVIYKECRGGNTIVCSMKKCNLITFHTARRSCITNLFKRGYSINHLMSLSGHRSAMALERYIKASDGEMGMELWKNLKKEGAI